MTKVLSRVGIAAVLGAAAAITVIPAPAFAAYTSCNLIYTDYVCDTGTLTPNAHHHLYAQAIAYSAPKINCWVYDTKNWDTVAKLTSTGHTAYKTIKGLYSTYVMGCAQGDSSNYGSGSGEIDNDSSF